MQRVWEKKRAYRFCWGNMNGRRYFEDLGIGGDVIGKCGLECSGSEQAQVEGCCKHGNISMVSIFLE